MPTPFWRPSVTPKQRGTITVRGSENSSKFISTENVKWSAVIFRTICWKELEWPVRVPTSEITIFFISYVQGPPRTWLKNSTLHLLTLSGKIKKMAFLLFVWWCYVLLLLVDREIERGQYKILHARIIESRVHNLQQGPPHAFFS